VARDAVPHVSQEFSHCDVGFQHKTSDHKNLAEAKGSCTETFASLIQTKATIPEQCRNWDPICTRREQ